MLINPKPRRQIAAEKFSFLENSNAQVCIQMPVHLIRQNWNFVTEGSVITDFQEWSHSFQVSNFSLGIK